MKIEILCENPWLELRKMVDKENGVNGYVYAHEKRCNGKILSILPFAINLEGSIEYLLRKEVTPCWGMEPKVSSITGGYEGKNMLDDVRRELKEEGGYDVSEDEIISLGTCLGTKSSDTVYHLFSANLTGKPQGEAKGDGSELEAKAHCFWSGSIADAEDPFVYVSFCRLRDKLKKFELSKNEPIIENMKRFLSAQEDLDPKFAKALNENFWNLT